MNVCVLGGTGFVGTELVTRLALDGHWVRVPTRQLSHGDQLRVLDTVELIVANVHEPRVLGQLFNDTDVVINLVGILNEHGRTTFRLAHTDLAAKVVAAARTARVRRLLHMSALGADADHPGRAPSNYLRTKGEAEAHVRTAASHLAFTIFRPSVIFGPADSLTNRFAGLLRLSAGVLPLARANARFAPIYVLDVVEAFLRALQDRKTIGQTYELCGPDVMTLEQIVRTTAAGADLPCHIWPLPDALARVQAAVMDFFPGKPFSSDNYRSLTIDSLCRENGCARLGISPQPMLAILPTYLGHDIPEEHLEELRRSTGRG